MADFSSCSIIGANFLSPLHSTLIANRNSVNATTFMKFRFWAIKTKSFDYDYLDKITNMREKNCLVGPKSDSRV